ncbi:SMC-Scp complex subunit ScpB [Weissella diestrammenae]|uniref:Segregation and condensation protein B n=1 Tax=Weissella diestrammenae TaxID=1162633 RepID=A0A7G9T5Q7_9LACO|nr:SMC-Scp complex subunit ScpB [Weissella diestrammenae]MCM0582258.1 SMC-Scp complex subunit ScpB [Weissella diestrammenae]QNN75432.1 SMC-Scp complex subunit ScpB [Weissella diestrammenae]
MTNLQQIEALLFVAGDEGVTIAELAHATEFAKPAVKGLLDSLTQRYVNDDDSALALLQTADRYQLVTKTSLVNVVQRYFTAPLTTALSQASLEVLAIVAYRQPITRMEVDEIRGVQSSSTLQKLVMRDLVTSKGKADEPGRPNLYGTTDYFLNYFGLSQITELPPLVNAAALDELQSQANQTVPLMPSGEQQTTENTLENEEQNG